ncbi:MAG: hypothetical protein ACRDR6_04715 [Pseudonocardiaceae bacterium]
MPRGRRPGAEHLGKEVATGYAACPPPPDTRARAITAATLRTVSTSKPASQVKLARSASDTGT